MLSYVFMFFVEVLSFQLGHLNLVYKFGFRFGFGFHNQDCSYEFFGMNCMKIELFLQRNALLKQSNFQIVIKTLPHVQLGGPARAENRVILAEHTEIYAPAETGAVKVPHV